MTEEEAKAHGKATRQNEPAGVRRGPPCPSGAVRRQLSLPRRPGPRQPRSSASGLPPGDAQRRCAPHTSPSLTKHNETTTAPWASPAQAGACWPPRRRQALLAPPPVPASLQSLALPSPPPPQLSPKAGRAGLGPRTRQAALPSSGVSAQGPRGRRLGSQPQSQDALPGEAGPPPPWKPSASCRDKAELSASLLGS